MKRVNVKKESDILYIMNNVLMFLTGEELEQMKKMLAIVPLTKLDLSCDEKITNEKRWNKMKRMKNEK